MTLGLPYLGFYADWEQAPLFDDVPDGGLLHFPTRLVGASTDYIGGNYLGMGFGGTYDYSKLAFSADYNGEGTGLGLDSRTAPECNQFKSLCAGPGRQRDVGIQL